MPETLKRQNSPDIRIAVVGTSCSGKTTLSKQIAHALGVQHFELDALYWGPDWTHAPREDFRRTIAIKAAEEAWVMDGNYSRVRDIIWPRATHLIWLNLPFLRVFRQAFARTVRRAWTREELWAGNRESFRLSFFDQDSILLWVIRTHHRNIQKYQGLIQEEKYQHLRVLELKVSLPADEVLTRLDTPG